MLSDLNITVLFLKVKKTFHLIERANFFLLHIYISFNAKQKNAGFYEESMNNIYFPLIEISKILW